LKKEKQFHKKNVQMYYARIYTGTCGALYEQENKNKQVGQLSAAVLIE
jgi:hypothetical protein